MKKLYKILGILFILTLIGCSSLEPKELPKMSGSLKSTVVMDAIFETFKDNGFMIKKFDTKYGKIESGWREFDSFADTTSTVVGLAETVMGKKKGLTSYSTEIILKAKITEQGYTIVTQINKKKETIGGDFEDSSEIYNAEEGSEEAKFAESMADSINKKLEKNNLFNWGWTGLEVDLR